MTGVQKVMGSIPVGDSDSGAGEKLKLCGILGANCAGKNVDCAGNCAGLRNLVTNQIFNLKCSSQTRQGGNSV